MLKTGKNEGFAILIGLILLAVISAVTLYMQSYLNNARRFQQGLIAGDTLSSLSNEAALALRDLNYCPTLLTAAVPISTNPSTPTPVTVQYAGGPTLATTGGTASGITLSAVQLNFVRQVGSTGDNAYLYELGVSGSSPSGYGGTLLRKIPIYLKLTGGAITQCFSTAYVQKMGAAVTQITFEDQACILAPPAVPPIAPSHGTIFNPWPNTAAAENFCN